MSHAKFLLHLSVMHSADFLSDILGVVRNGLLSNFPDETLHGKFCVHVGHFGSGKSLKYYM